MVVARYRMFVLFFKQSTDVIQLFSTRKQTTYRFYLLHALFALLLSQCAKQNTPILLRISALPLRIYQIWDLQCNHTDTDRYSSVLIVQCISSFVFYMHKCTLEVLLQVENFSRCLFHNLYWLMVSTLFGFWCIYDKLKSFQYDTAPRCWEVCGWYKEGPRTFYTSKYDSYLTNVETILS